MSSHLFEQKYNQLYEMEFSKLLQERCNISQFTTNSATVYDLPKESPKSVDAFVLGRNIPQSASSRSQSGWNSSESGSLSSSPPNHESVYFLNGTNKSWNSISTQASLSPPRNRPLAIPQFLTRGRTTADYSLLFEDEDSRKQICDPIALDIDRWLSVFESTSKRSVALDKNIWLQFLRRVKGWYQRKLEASMDLCVFCRNNNEPYEMYISHKIRDASGRVTCPVLRRYTCPICGVSGDLAHTLKYCPRGVMSSSAIDVPKQSDTLHRSNYCGRLDNRGNYR